jgi:ribonuclease Z
MTLPTYCLTFAELRKVYSGPVVQTQDLTVFNITKEAVVARQAQIMPQAMPVMGVPSIKPTHGVRPADPTWWAESLLPVDDVLALP